VLPDRPVACIRPGEGTSLPKSIGYLSAQGCPVPSFFARTRACALKGGKKAGYGGLIIGTLAAMRTDLVGTAADVLAGHPLPSYHLLDQLRNEGVEAAKAD
jgi:hypothetical protein